MIAWDVAELVLMGSKYYSVLHYRKHITLLQLVCFYGDIGSFTLFSSGFQRSLKVDIF